MSYRQVRASLRYHSSSIISSLDAQAVYIHSNMYFPVIKWYLVKNKLHLSATDLKEICVVLVCKVTV